jgi:tetratricopeptide (TPR) repeat protein
LAGDKPATSLLVEPAGSGTGAQTGDLDPWEREVAQCRSHLSGEPTNAALYLRLARLYREAGQLETAHSTLTEGLSATGNAFDLMRELAALEIEPFRRNLAITEEKLAVNPQDEELRRIQVHLTKEINTRELDLHRLCADRFPSDLGHRYEVGVRLLRAGQLDEAIHQLQSSRDDARFRWQSSLFLGYCFQARNNWRLAQRNFEEALQTLPPDDTSKRKDILYELACGHAAAGDLVKALDLAHELAHLDFSYRDISVLLEQWQTRLQQAQAS